ncbi:MAG: spore protease YyaC [Firmicutes bacterium]|jgi:putative sporulation protein YyaC|nr:spore protease YyaC [Bacillota bacterium]NLL87363.1 spore protease YyaC [Bacillota bacterium]HKM17384.1 spore protease YyaC [Limnochordia bacterium]
MDDPLAAETLALSIARITQERHLVVVCVGTDRSTGDSLGPLIGTGLLKHLPPNITVYGCLDEPVHALNLENFVTKIKSKHQDSLVLAIDACLGKSENVGYISLKTGPLKPGTGVNKALPEIGDFHIIGVVNVGGMMEYFVLQNTRLSLVIRMSEIIIKGLLMSVRDVSVHRA